MPEGRQRWDHAPEFKHVDDMEWEMGRFKNRTKFFSFIPVRIVQPNRTLAFSGTSPGRVFPSTDTTSRKSGTSSRANSAATARPTAQEHLFTPDPHFEHAMTTESGGTVVFLQYPGPTTGARPIYDGRMNLTKAESPEEYDLNR